MNYKLKSMLSNQSKNSKTRSNFLANSNLRLNMKMADLTLREAEVDEVKHKAGVLFRIYKSDSKSAFDLFKLSGDVTRNVIYSFTLSYSSFAIWERLSKEQLTTADMCVLFLSYILVASLGIWINISAANYMCNVYLERRRLKTQKLPGVYVITLAVFISSTIVSIVTYFSSKEVFLSLRPRL